MSDDNTKLAIAACKCISKAQQTLSQKRGGCYSGQAVYIVPNKPIKLAQSKDGLDLVLPEGTKRLQ